MLQVSITQESGKGHGNVCKFALSSTDGDFRESLEVFHRRFVLTLHMKKKRGVVFELIRLLAGWLLQYG